MEVFAEEANTAEDELEVEGVFLNYPEHPRILEHNATNYFDNKITPSNDTIKSIFVPV